MQKKKKEAEQGRWDQNRQVGTGGLRLLSGGEWCFIADFLSADVNKVTLQSCNVQFRLYSTLWITQGPTQT